MRLVAAASDPRALDCLGVLAAPPHVLLALVTAPDRPRGRGRELHPSAPAAWAGTRGIPVLQPDDVNAPGPLEAIRRLSPDALAVIAYGQKLAPALLALPRHGCLNLHPSLLPRHRGAAPVARAILAGDAETGVCVIRMAERMDAGPVLASAKEPVGPEDTAGSLGDRLFARGALLFREVLDRLERGEALAGTPQDEARATRAPALRKEEGLLRWEEDAGALARRVRALVPWPGAFAFLSPGQGQGTRRIALWKARALEGPGGPPGSLLDLHGAPLAVACGRGALALLELQAGGHRRLSAGDFLRGARLGPGARFVPSP